jgi:hypothetical protein
MINRLVCALLLLGLAACSKKQDDVVINNAANKINSTPYPGYKEYLIPANQHYATDNGLKLVNAKVMHFQALFDSSCIYTSRVAENVYDINKLYGFSDCGTLHHNNSARVGWLWNGKAIELYAYTYADSARSSLLLGTVAIGAPANISMSVQPHQYLFSYNGSTSSLPRSCTSDSIQGYQLYPYFGGDETAPHDIHIYIKDL